MSRFKEVHGGSTQESSPDSSKSVSRGGFLDANFFFRDLYQNVLKMVLHHLYWKIMKTSYRV